MKVKQHGVQSQAQFLDRSFSSLTEGLVHREHESEVLRSRHFSLPSAECSGAEMPPVL